MSGAVPVPPLYKNGVDCSPAEQDDRRKMLKDLYAKRFSGVQSVSDRSRSVNYQSPGDLQKAINSLEKMIALCDGTLRKDTGRIRFAPYNKWM